MFCLLLTILAAKLVAPQYMLEPPPRRIGNITRQLNCGGLELLKVSGGRCGTCGEPFNSTRSRDRIVPSRTYLSNSIINVSVYVGRFRPGWFEFRICRQPTDNVLTQDCFDRLILNIIDVNATRMYLKQSRLHKNGTYNVRLYIPGYASCNHCVLQWKYQTSDTLGKDKYDSIECIGCGIQETFKDCAYIRIRNKNKLLINRPYLRDQMKAYPARRRLLRNQPPNRLTLSSRIFPEEPKQPVTPDRVCMSKTEYDQFRETVNLLEYLIHRLKHESLRELTMQRDLVESVPNSASFDGKGQFYQSPPKQKEIKKLASNITPLIRKQSRRDFNNYRSTSKNSKMDVFCKVNCHKGFCPKSICRC